MVKGYDGMGNMVFTNSTVLRFNPKSSSTFIQTDKANYGPGQVVKIRAVSIYPDGKPYKGKIDIIIKVCVTVTMSSGYCMNIQCGSDSRWMEWKLEI